MAIGDLCACEFVQGSHSALLVGSKFRWPKKLMRMHCPMPRNGHWRFGAASKDFEPECSWSVGRPYRCWTRVYFALAFSWQQLADFWPFSVMCLDGSHLFWRTMAEEVTLQCVMCQGATVILQGSKQKDSAVSNSRCSRLRAHTYLYKCTYTCTHTYTFVYMYIYICIHIHIHIHILFFVLQYSMQRR